MKFGIRTPSLKRRLAARTSWKRFVRHSLGIKAPRGFGILTNPKKAIYNKLYNKTTIGVEGVIKGSTRSNNSQSRNLIKPPGGVSKGIIFAVIALFTPLWFIGLGYIIYKIVKNQKAKQNISQTTYSTNIDQPITSGQTSNALLPGIYIPEPTKSLLWVTNEDPSKAESPFTIKVNIHLGGSEPRVEVEQPNFYAEPSLIWTRMPIEPNQELEEKPMYYPQYARLFAQNKYQYLNWLQDVTKPTNLSYVFLYFYGLERHLLIGDFDRAVDEIVRLLKYHNGSFKGYAVRSLIGAALHKKRPDILNKAPFILDQVSNVTLVFRALQGGELTTKDLISLTNLIEYKDKYYMRKYPEDYESELQLLLAKEENILSKIDVESLPKQDEGFFTNMSIPEQIRTIKVPQLTENFQFRVKVKELLDRTNEIIKGKKQRTKKGSITEGQIIS